MPWNMVLLNSFLFLSLFPQSFPKQKYDARPSSEPYRCILRPDQNLKEFLWQVYQID